MSLVNPQTLKGFMELLPKDQILFNKVKEVIRSNYEKFGFLPIDTPVLEYKEVLLSKAGGETEKQIYEFTKGDTNIAMRFDLTVPLAKYCAKNQNELNFPFKRYQIAKVYRGERPQRGRFREFYQADIDIIGNESLSILNDAELPSVIYNIFKELEIGKFTIKINNRKILNGFYEELGLNNKVQEILRIIDKLDKIGIELVTNELRKMELDGLEISKILEFINLKGTNEEIIAKLENMNIKNEMFNLGVSELKEVVNNVYNFGVPKEYIQVDLTIARGLDYYTGTVYETMLDDYNIGSICSGGRYDNLASNFTTKKLPGVGISIGLTRLFDQLTNLGIIKSEKTTTTKILLVPMIEDKRNILKLANIFRSNNINTEVYMENKKLKAVLKYANNQEVPFVGIIGEEEENEKVILIKNMITGNQEKVNITDVQKIIDLIK